MTEKQFTHKKWYNVRQLFDGDELFAIVDVYIQAEAICDKLNDLEEARSYYQENFLTMKTERNQLKEENEQLEKENTNLIIDNKELKCTNIELAKKNEQLKQKLKKYEEIEELKKEDFINCHNCKNNRSVHDGVVLDGMCAIKELMNLDGYFDTEYHKLPSGTICPCWELEE